MTPFRLFPFISTMNTTTIPVYQVEVCEDIDYRQIFSEVNVGESFIVRYNRGDQYTCNRVAEWDVFIPGDSDYPDAYVEVNPTDYRWRSRS